MTKATNTKMMDTEPGGENTQYESQATFQQPHATASGQLGGGETPVSSKTYICPRNMGLIKLKNTGRGPTEADQQKAAQKQARGEQTAENIRYGEAISEHGFGGETTTNSGETGVGSRDGEELRGTGEQRRKQGYSEEGSGIGA